MPPNQPSETAMELHRKLWGDEPYDQENLKNIDAAYASLVETCGDVKNWLTMLNDAGDVGGYEQDVLDKFVAALALATPKGGKDALVR